MISFHLPSVQIKIGDHDIKEMNVRWLREHIGIVSQEPVLFDMSIADNIKMGKTDATQQEIEYAAINANAHDFISDLPKVNVKKIKKVCQARI